MRLVFFSQEQTAEERQEEMTVIQKEGDEDRHLTMTCPRCGETQCEPSAPCPACNSWVHSAAVPKIAKITRIFRGPKRLVPPRVAG